MRVSDQRGLGKQLKRILPQPVFRGLTVAYNKAMAEVPAGPKYNIGLWFRARKAPYSYIQSGDWVVQVGAPRDILGAGRSRAIYFAKLVGSGKVLVVEPDPENVAALRAFLRAEAMEDRVIVEPCGAWDKKTDLTFLSSPHHPAANVLEGVEDISEEDMRNRGYERVKVSVDSLDNIADKHGIAKIKLVSITTNGAERQIVAGMEKLLQTGVPWVSLASTGPDYIPFMKSHGYRYAIRDDRGYLFAQEQN